MSEELDADVAVAGPSILSTDGKETQLLRKAYDFRLYLCSKKPFYYLHNFSHKFDTEYPYTTDKFVFNGMVSGSCFMIDSKTFRNIGYFDKNVFLYSEEWIIAWKLGKISKKVCYVPQASVTHLHGQSTKKNGKGFESLHLYLSAFYYLKYYVKINIIEQLFVYMQNLSVFILRSVFDKTYRKNLHILIKYSNEILLSKKNSKIQIRNDEE